jgi:hypothetical protein
MSLASHPLRNATPVESFSLASVAYDDELAILQVEFRDGTVYQYLGVPSATHQDLCQADSKGVYFNQHIRNRFPHTKLGPSRDGILG